VATYNVSYEWSIAEHPDAYTQFAEHSVSDVPDKLSGKALLAFIQTRIRQNAPLVVNIRNLKVH